MSKWKVSAGKGTISARLLLLEPLCTKRGPRGKVCGGTVTRDAYNERVCLQCVRKAIGTCRFCPRPVEGARGRAELCPDCKKVAEHARHARWYYGKLEANRKRAREKKRINPDRPMTKAEVLALARAVATARFGGCGQARAAALSPERRKEISRKALDARWGPHRRKREAEDLQHGRTGDGDHRGAGAARVVGRAGGDAVPAVGVAGAGAGDDGGGV